MTTLQTLRIAALAGACLVQFAAVAQAQDNSGFDISNAPAASQAPVAQNLSGSIGEVTFGVGGVTQSSAAFGRYNGMPDSGAGFVGGWNLRTGDAWDSGSTRYYSFTGDNVNVGFGGGFAPEATIDLKIGDQGSWEAFANYDAMTYTATDNFTTILDREGNLSPGYNSALTALGTNGPYIGTSYTSATAPTYFGAVGSAKHYPGGLNIQSASVGSTVGYVLGAGITYPASPAALAPYNSAASPSNYDIYLGSLNELTYKIGTRRDKGTVGGKYETGDWTLGATVSHEHKEGSLEQAMTTQGSNAGMIAFPMPIDYDTDAYTATAAYDTDRLQAHFSYEFSNFIDHNSAGYAFQGYNFTEVRTGSASPYTYASYGASGVYSLPPSNQAHTFSAEVAYNLDPTTRLNGTVVYGLQLQNDPFVAPTTDPFARSNFASYFNANPTSLNGLVQTWFANFALYTRPLSELTLKASYTLDARDTQTKPMGIYGDPTDALTPTTINLSSSTPGNGCVPLATCTTPWQRLAVPESWTKQTFAVSAEYHVTSSTRITAGYTFKDDERTNAITHRTQENAESVKIFSSFAPDMTASLGYVHSDRTASAPDFSLWTQQIMSDCISNTNGVFNPGTLGCQQVPFYEAARTQDAFDGLLTAANGEQLSVSLFGKYTNNQYHNPAAVYSASGTTPFPVLPSVGINRDYSLQGGPDLNYQVNKNVELHAYYTFLRTYRDMRALNNQSGSVAPPGSLEYSEASTYDIHTAGIGGTWQASDKLKFGADYIFSYGSQAFAQSGSWTTGEGHQLIGGDPLLNTKSANNQIKLHATYDYSSATSFYFGYQFDSLDMTDWALVGASVGQVLTGDVPPKFNVSTFTIAMTVKL